MRWYRAIKRRFLIEGGHARITSALKRSVRQSSPVAAVRVVTCGSHDRSYSNRDVETVGQPARVPHEERWKSISTYFLVCLATVLGCYALFLGGLLLLRANGNLPLSSLSQIQVYRPLRRTSLLSRQIFMMSTLRFPWMQVMARLCPPSTQGSRSLFKSGNTQSVISTPPLFSRHCSTRTTRCSDRTKVCFPARPTM